MRLPKVTLFQRLPKSLSSSTADSEARELLQFSLSCVTSTPSRSSRKNSAFKHFRIGSVIPCQFNMMMMIRANSTTNAHVVSEINVGYPHGDGVTDQTVKKADEICKLLISTPPNTSRVETALGSCGFELEASPSLVLEVLRKLGNAGLLALDFFRWAEKQQGFKHSTDIYNSLIESLGKIKQFKMVWVLVESMKKKGLLTKDTFMFTIRRYARAKKVKEAVDAFEKMEEFGLKPDSSDFNRFLDTLSKSRQVFKAQEMFDKMKKKRFTPDKKTYGILMEGWGEQQDFSKLEEIYEEMEREGLEADAVTFGIVMNAYCKAGKLDQALQKFQEMEAKNCKPTPHIYCIMISGLGSRKRLGEALKFFEMSKASGLKLEAPTYNAVVGSYCWSHKFEDARKIIDEMRIAGVGPNSRTYDIILHHLIKDRRTNEAFDIFQLMSKNSQGSCKPTVSTYEIILRMFCNQGKVGTAIKVWNQMKNEGILPNMHMFSTLISRLCSEMRLDEACKYFEEMLDVGIRPSGPLFGNLKQALLAGGKKDVVNLLSEKLDKIRKTPVNC